MRMLDNRYALLFIRGENAVKDEKFDILKHPNVELTTDGSAEPYHHGEVTEAVAGISLWNSLEGEVTESEVDAGEYEVLSEEDLENMYSENGGKEK